jgi:hypothetical protein
MKRSYFTEGQLDRLHRACAARGIYPDFWLAVDGSLETRIRGTPHATYEAALAAVLALPLAPVPSAVPCRPLTQQEQDDLLIIELERVAAAVQAYNPYGLLQP